MKLLHIGNPRCMGMYTEKSDFTRSVEVVDLPMGLSVSRYLERGTDAEVMVTDAIAHIPAELINAMPNLKLIHSEGVGYNGIDVACASQKGVYVCNSAGMNAQAVAEQTVLLMLGVLRDVAGGDRAVREGRQMEVKNAYMAVGSLRDLADCRVGLIGLGSIGQRTAAILSAFGSLVFYTQRHRATAQTEQACGAAWLETRAELLRTCDIVSLHVPVTPETAHMAGADFFAAMKPGAYFINTSRGELVEDAALAAALESGHLAMAGLDTLDNEPVENTHPLLNLPGSVGSRLLFSPHIGGITGTSFRTSYRIIWENIRRIAAGETPKNAVNAPLCAAR